MSDIIDAIADNLVDDHVVLLAENKRLRDENAALLKHAEKMAFLIEDGTGDSVWLAAVKAYRERFPAIDAASPAR